MKTLHNSEGQPVFFLCRSVLGPAWRKFVISQKEKRGIIKKVYEFLSLFYLSFPLQTLLSQT